MIFKYRNKPKVTPYLFVLPVLGIVGGVTLYPLFYTVVHSLFDTRLGDTTKFVGFLNYIRVFQNPSFLQQLRVSLVFTVGSLLVAIPIAVLAAIALNRTFALRNVLQCILVFPWVISEMAAALIWLWILNPLYGPVNYFLQNLGLPKFDALGDAVLALPTLILINVWRTFPFAMILILAAIKSIPRDVYEAAKVDGATRVQTLLRITLPMIQNSVMNAVVFLSLLYIRMVTLILGLTGGGPAGATETIGMRTYIMGFDYWDTGRASAMALVIFVINIILSLGYIKVLKGESYV